VIHPTRQQRVQRIARRALAVFAVFGPFVALYYLNSPDSLLNRHKLELACEAAGVAPPQDYRVLEYSNGGLNFHGDDGDFDRWVVASKKPPTAPGMTLLKAGDTVYDSNLPFARSDFITPWPAKIKSRRWQVGERDYQLYVAKEQEAYAFVFKMEGDY
jgi:hypothetical protein